MRRVWATVVSVWALLAVVAAIAWTNPVTPHYAQPATTLVVKGKHGATQRVIVVGAAAHGTTQTSPPPVG